MEQISILVAFGAGLLSFLSPCVIPLVPVYLASLYGPEIFDEPVVGRRFPIFLHALTFVIGFSVVFILFGAGAGLAGFILNFQLALVRQISGGLLVAFGIFMLAAFKIPWLNYEKRLAPSRSRTTGYLRSFLTGAIFAPAWTPCVGPILAGILTIAMGSGTAGQGAYLLAIYSLGLGLPFLAMGGAFDFIAPRLKRIYRYSWAISIFSGVLLIAVGILILTDKMIWFQI
jgi:cytochrome c-type biogenesis protein